MLVSGLASDAEAMTPRTLPIESIVAAGHRRFVWRRAAVSCVAVACVAGLTVVTVNLIARNEIQGRVIESAEPSVTELQPEAERTLKRFVGALNAKHDRAAWNALSNRARDSVGGFHLWSAARGRLASFVGWIDAQDVEVVLTRIPGGEAPRYVATAVAPPEGGRALLQPVTLLRDAGRLVVDLTAADLSREVSLDPVTPMFVAAACSPEGGCAAPEPPVISDGMLFNVSLTPGGGIAHVWFSIGSEWTAEAELAIASRNVLPAQATFEPDDMEPGEKVFLVTIETREGKLINYGYRVDYQG